MAVPIKTGTILAGNVFSLKASTQIFIIKYLYILQFRENMEKMKDKRREKTLIMKGLFQRNGVEHGLIFPV